ncbi:GrpB family protein [Streptomyces spectabilis]|uniref:GrpB family protein n=1 Tax=Streptomyces spectabilis TaxID=68270 RepID=A0A5P2X571_STRST|nr:GrpB family protein [Streptomyces spectabilis]MBB5109378.1 GrpB-like predicted nucleotidyltransferase (UPF0157 family) [Streptomyces spectabilis]MCI3899892.1 GrpB family protein [Streptomyces spectabilis]QEV57542.1 GrpB family protein [Streptomyces spectabilis]GGV42168.1 hypothetical protein GCM10010245_66160 [Streptomyces spectabilis]
MSIVISVSEYDPQWAAEFTLLRDQLASRVADLALSIEHVGSTAAPGCAAKPIIDLDIVVTEPSTMAVPVTRLAAAGYRHGDLGVAGREAFQAPLNARPHHLYAVVSESKPYLDHILLRDYLRHHPDQARRYSQFKKWVALQSAADREGRTAYSEAKRMLVKELLSKALPTKAPGNVTQVAAEELRAHHEEANGDTAYATTRSGPEPESLQPKYG